MRSRISMAFYLSFLWISILLVPASYAQKMTHIVQKGDTLWDICEEYYGDPDLWPKLWQMNPFITNPHLLKPGDVITLFEKEMLKKLPKTKKPEIQAVEKEKGPNAIDLSMLIDLSKRGFLSSTPIEPHGQLFATKNDKLIIQKNDTAYLVIKKPGIKKGDMFLAGEVIGPLKDPVSSDKKWYLFSLHGRILIEDPVGLEFGRRDDLIDKKDTYQVKIINSFKPITVGDIIVPAEPVSDCVLPASFQEPVLANIVATEEQRELIGKNDIVYINQGRNQSIQRGNLLEIVKPHYAKNPTPTNKKFTKPNFMVLPDVPLGLCLVIDTRPDSATAVVLTINEPFVLGTYVKNQSWDDHQDLLLGIKTCTLN